jgi:serine/threonine-protein kinase
VTTRRPITADQLFGDAAPEPDAVLEGAELVRAHWRIKGREKDLARQEQFWASTNKALAKAYEELEERTAELKRAREDLLGLNTELEQRVAAQVLEIVQHARDVDALNVQLRAQVQERSRELAEALRGLSHGAVDTTTLRDGDVVGGRVRIQRWLGRGGMGTVYLGEDLLTGHTVAVKVMNPEVGKDPDVLARFLNEAAAAAAIDHPGIIKTLHVDVGDAGRLYQIMEYVDGQTLASVLTSGPLGVALAARVGAAIAGALAAAHARSIVHRDIKAANLILCRRAPGVRVLDFGLAKVLRDQRSVSSGGLTKAGDIMGTPEYMSPEQIRDFSQITPRSDVYSLGVVLHEMAAGRLPFSAAAPAGHLVAHLTQPPPDLRDVVADAPPAFANLVTACLAKEASDRPTAAELGSTLHALAEALGAPPAENILEARAGRAVAATWIT